MKKIQVAALLALASLSSQAMATSCTETFSLGSIGMPGAAFIGNSFDAPTSFVDCYNFNLAGDGQVSGFTLEFDSLFDKLAIDLSSVSLWGGSLASAVTDFSPGAFGTSGLLAGSYTLAVAGDVSRSGGFFNLGVGYGGLLLATGKTSVPEPATLAMFGLGLLGVAFASRRRRGMR